VIPPDVGGLSMLDERFSEGGGFKGSRPPRALAGSDLVLSTGSSIKSLLANILISGVEAAAGSVILPLSSVRSEFKLSLLLFLLDN